MLGLHSIHFFQSSLSSMGKKQNIVLNKMAKIDGVKMQTFTNRHHQIISSRYVIITQPSPLCIRDTSLVVLIPYHHSSTPGNFTLNKQMGLESTINNFSKIIFLTPFILVNKIDLITKNKVKVLEKLKRSFTPSINICGHVWCLRLTTVLGWRGSKRRGLSTIKKEYTVQTSLHRNKNLNSSV